MTTPTLSRLERENAELRERLREARLAAKEMLPRNLCLTNPNVRDDAIIPLECTMGELRRIAAAILPEAPEASDGR